MFPANLVSRGIVALPILVCVLAAAAAEPKKKSVATAPSASLRVWTGDLPSKRALRVSLVQTSRKAGTSDLVDSAESYRFTGYVSVPVGAGTVEVRDTKAPTIKLATLPVQLPAGAFATVLIRENGGSIAAQLLDDMPGGERGELVVRNFIPTLTAVQIDAGPDVHLRLASPECFVHLRGLPRGKLEVNTSGTESKGQPLRWTSEIDFTQFRRATLLICPDHYGRIRPRVVIDGEVPVPASTSDTSR